MSATQSWFGREATKFRSTRSGAGLASLYRRVVVTPPRRRLPALTSAARGRLKKLSRKRLIRPARLMLLYYLFRVIILGHVGNIYTYLRYRDDAAGAAR